MKTQQKISSSLLLVFAFVLLSVSFFTTHSSAKDFAKNIIVMQVGPEFNRELNCLAENIYFEAGAESYEGKLAVANVVINRMNSGKFPSSVCGVVKQKIGNTYQFSWVGEKFKSVTNKYQWDESVFVARKALTEPAVHDIINKTNAMYYHNTTVNPGWHLTRITTIGKHIFYKEKI